MHRVRPGINRFLAKPIPLPGRGRAAVLCNASTVSTDWGGTVETLRSVPGLHVERIFSPQHGFSSEKQDNMVESSDTIHPGSGIPVVSLYGKRREPSIDDMSDLDLLFIDLQDVGTRVYTFLITALLSMKRAAERGLPVVFLDRPNPIGGKIEGPVLEEGFHSFVGMVDVPLRHGLTPAEFCLYGAWRLGILDEADASGVAVRARRGNTGDAWLRIVPVDHWNRSLFHDETGLPWTMPSPNMPALDTAIVYPGQVALEGTNLSEGRGTTRPFEFFGAPYLEPKRLLEILADSRESENGSSPLDGALLRVVHFEPTFHKYAGQLVRGFQIHVLDRHRFRPVLLTTAILCAIHSAYREAFAWRDPPYEYEYDRPPIDLIYGTDRVRRAIESGIPATQIAGEWEAPVSEFRQRVKPFLLYGA